MKIEVDGKLLFTISEIQKKVLQYEMLSETFEDDVKATLRHIWEHKFHRCFDRLKQEWDPKFVSAGMTSVPTDKELYAELVFSQPEYKNRDTREVERDKEREIFLKKDLPKGTP